MDDKFSYPSRYQPSYWLLELTATCGELSADLFTKLHESPSYLEAVIRSLKKDKLLRVYYRDKVCSYRLCVKAKDFLVADNYDRFSFYVTGNSYTNILRSELPRHLRLHRLAEVYVLMLGCGVAFSIIPGIYELLQATFNERADAKAQYPDTVFAIHIASFLFNHDRELSKITKKACFSIMNSENNASVRIFYDRATGDCWKKHMWDDYLNIYFGTERIQSPSVPFVIVLHMN